MFLTLTEQSPRANCQKCRLRPEPLWQESWCEQTGTIERRLFIIFYAGKLKQDFSLFLQMGVSCIVWFANLHVLSIFLIFPKEVRSFQETALLVIFNLHKHKMKSYFTSMIKSEKSDIIFQERKFLIRPVWRKYSKYDWYSSEIKTEKEHWDHEIRKKFLDTSLGFSSSISVKLSLEHVVRFRPEKRSQGLVLDEEENNVSEN